MSSAPDTPRATMPAWTVAALVVLATALAAALRLAHLGRDDLWIDEAYTLGLGQHGFIEMLSLFTREANGILYQLIIFPVAQLDDSIVALRMPAAIAGILAVPAVYWAGRELLGRRAGVAGAVLMAASPLAVTHSQDARPIIFVALLSSLSFACLATAARSATGSRWWVLYALATALVFYSNLVGGAVLLIPQLLFALRQSRAFLRVWLISVGAVVLILIPLAVLTLAERSKRNPLYWLAAPTPGDVLDGIRTIFGGVVVVAVVIVMAAALLIRRRGSWPARRDLLSDPLLIVAVWALAPPLALAAASLITPIFLPRYAITALPGACLLAGGLAARFPLPAACALVLVMVLATGRQVVGEEGTGTEWRLATASIQTAVANGDPIIFDTGSGLGPAGYYDPKLSAPDGDLVIAEWRNSPIPANVVLLDDPGGYGRTAIGPPDAALISQLSRQTGRVDVVLSSIAPSQGDVENRGGLAWARENCTLRAERFVGVDVLHISACRPTT